MEQKVKYITDSEMDDLLMLSTAHEIAAKAHEGVPDKGGAPYIEHPIAVAGMLETPIEKAAALLHDVLEDTAVTAEDLLSAGIPKEVVDIVQIVSRQIRHGKKETYFNFIRRIRDSKNQFAINLKLADLAHNSSPERIAKLPEEQQDIVKRYEKATKILTGEMQ